MGIHKDRQYIDKGNMSVYKYLNKSIKNTNMIIYCDEWKTYIFIFF